MFHNNICLILTHLYCLELESVQLFTLSKSKLICFLKLCIPISSIIDVIKSRIPFWLWHTRMYSIENFLCFTWISILNDTIMLVFKSMMDSYLRQKRMYFFIPTRVIHYVLLLLLFFVHLNVYQCLIKNVIKKLKRVKM